MQHTKPRYLLEEGFKLLSLSRSKGYERIKRGHLKVIYDGGTPYITADEIDAYAAQAHPPIDYKSKGPTARNEQRAE